MNTPPNTRPVSIQPGRCLLLGLALLTVNALLPTEAAAQTNVPLLVNYQGTVTDSTGLPLGATGTVSAPVAAPVNRKIIFRFWDAATGGTRLWTEEQTVTISLGQFSVLLGQGINATGTAAGESRPALDTVFTGTGNDRFLGVTVDNGDNNITGADTEITPRQRITSVAYSLRARAADSVASTTDLMLGGSANHGLGWYGTGRTFGSPPLAVNGPVLYGQGGGVLGAVNGATQTPVLRWNELGQVGIGTTAMPSGSELTLQGDDTNTPPLHLNIRGNTETNKRLLIGYNTTGNYGAIQAYNGTSGTPTTTTALLLNQAGGNVGIGMATAPTVALDVTGTINASVALTTPLVRPVSVTGTNVAGTAFTLAGGNGTGTGGGGALIFQTAPAGTTGASANTLTERMRITNAGNVGIGTTTPRSMLDIAPATTTTDGIRIGKWADTASRYIGITNENAGFTFPTTGGFSGLEFGGPTSAAGGFLAFYTHDLGFGNGERMRIDKLGRVGIGTNSPGALLSLGSALANTKLMLYDDGTSFYGLGVQGNQFRLHTATLNDRFSFLNAPNGTENMTILGNGNVGIGTAAPGQKLDVIGGSQSQFFEARANSSTPYIDFSSNNVADYHARIIWQGTSVNRLDFEAPGYSFGGGSVGIGTTPNASRARLTVGSVFTTSGVNTPFPQGRYMDNTSIGAANTTWGGGTVSIEAQSNIVCNGVWATSDERIKKVGGHSDGAADLKTLLGIEVTDYVFKDQIANGGQPQKKVIAQQVEKIFPQAVSQGTNTVPDIFKKAAIKDGWVSLTTDLKKGDKVKLMDDKDAEAIHEVLEVKKDKFRTAFKTEAKEVFVYGREVNDFRRVDYEAISMLNVSATQQIKKEKDAEVKALKDENTALKARVEALEAAAKAREEAGKAIVMKLAALEKLLKSSEKPAAQQVSLKRSAGGAE